MPGKAERQEAPVIALCEAGGADSESIRGEEMEQGAKRKLIRLESLQIPDFCEDLGWDACALRAFGVLLESADLEGFSGSGDNAEILRVGLRKIVEMYLERQERKLNELRIGSINSYERVIKDARSTYEMVNQGAFQGPEVALEHVRKGLNRLALVIAECGDEYPQALVIREKLLALQEAITRKIKGRSKI